MKKAHNELKMVQNIVYSIVIMGKGKINFKKIPSSLQWEVVTLVWHSIFSWRTRSSLLLSACEKG
jgi:hypothetical protein